METYFLFRPPRFGRRAAGKLGSLLWRKWDLAVVYGLVSVLSISRKHQDSKKEEEKKKPHIKKPLNAFMLYMKEMRAKVVAECTLKESAAINQILGRRVGRSLPGKGGEGWTGARWVAWHGSPVPSVTC